MTPKDIKRCFECDSLVVGRLYQDLPIVQKDNSNNAIAWVSDNSRLFIGELDYLKTVVNIKNIKLLPKDKNGIVEIYVFLQSHLEKNNYRLRLKDLQKSVDLSQALRPFKNSELQFISRGIRLVLFHRLAQILSDTFVDQVSKAETIELKNIIASFLAQKEVDWEKFFETTSLVEKILNKDPAKIYPFMDINTRQGYHQIIEELSLCSDKSEVEIAEKILSKSNDRGLKDKDRHIGFFLYDGDRTIIEREIGYKYSWREKVLQLFTSSKYFLYFLPILLIMVLGVFLMAVFLSNNGYSTWLLLLYLLLLSIPIFIASENLINFVISKTIKPKSLLRMDFRTGIPLRARTMVVIPTQIGACKNESDELLNQLERNYLNSQMKNLYFGLLLAFRDNKNKNDAASPEEQSNLQKIKDGVDRLNKKYSDSEPVFFVFFRSRQWNEKEKANIEWERKRGKIVEFNRLLRGGATTFESPGLDYKFLSSIKYVITIDQDNLLLKESAQRLIATIAHPLNQARIDPISGIVKSGYGLIQPQMLRTPSVTSSLFEMAFSDNKGWDSYSGVAFNLYQDVFGSGLFSGKGIYDVDISNQVLGHRLPENTVLSHDHLEGFYVRSGCASDIQVLEDNPVSYSSYITRLMRWARGDLQNIFWVFGRVRDELGQKVSNPLGYFARYKLLENIFQTLFLPLIFTAFLSALFLNNTNLVIIYMVIGLLMFEPFLSLADVFISQRATLAWKDYYATLINQLVSVILLAIFRFVFFWHLSFLAIITVVKTIYRLLISKNHLLEWQIFHYSNIVKTKNIFGLKLRGFYFFELFCFGILFAKIIFGTMNLFSGILVGLAIITPILANIFSYDLSYMRNNKKIIDRDWFNRLAMKTWRYFDETVSQQTNYLPPDRWQLDVKRPFSRMTSITNIGLYLLSLYTAFRFGYLSLSDYLLKSQQLFETLNRMNRLNGHFYNWYNIKTLEALTPKYVSSVDSGNFVASLMAAENTYKSLGDVDIWSSSFWDTLRAVLTLTVKAMEHNGASSKIEIKNHRRAIRLLLDSINNITNDNTRCFYDNLNNINQGLAKNLAIYTTDGRTNNLRYWAAKSMSIVDSKIKEIELFYPWLVGYDSKNAALYLDIEKQSTLDSICASINATLSLKSIKSDNKRLLKKSLLAIKDVLQKSNNLSDECRKIYESTDFRFIYDNHKKLFYVAYDDVHERFDKYYYSSIGSEARLTSFVAIALNQIPLEHWQELSRSIAASNGRVALLSWGGSLFEYLFPQIFMDNVQGSFTDKVLKTAVLDHIKFAYKKGIPWGISESCYNQKNDEGDYQYSIHGVPHLSTRLSHDQNTVVSPYSSFMALELFPKATYHNLKRLEKEGAGGKYGFYEAIDYNKPIKSLLKGVPVQAFLCHHQSIILLSIYNYLNNGDLRNSFNQNQAIKSLGFILNEKITLPTTLRSAKEVVCEFKHPNRPLLCKSLKTEVDFGHLPLTSLISNGKYRIYVTNFNDGFSQYRDFNLNPRSNDPTQINQSNRVYIWDDKNDKLAMSVSPLLPNDNIIQTSEVTDNEVSFELSDQELQVNTTIGLMNNEDLEYRVLTIKNLTNKPKSLKVAYSNEQVLSNGFEDVFHPSFNRLKTKVDFEKDIWIYSKRRISRKPNIYTGHKTFVSDTSIALHVMTSRRDFVGRLPDSLSFTASDDLQHASVSGYGLAYGNVAKISLLPLAECKIVYLASASFSRKKIISLMDKYGSFKDFSKSLNNKECRFNIDIDLNIEQKLLSLLIYRRPINPVNILVNDKDYIGLPRLKDMIGANYDNPILLTRVDNRTPESSCRQLIKYAQNLASKGFGFNFVILTMDSDDYFNSNLDFIQKLLLENMTDRKPADIFKNLIIINENKYSPHEIKSLKLLSTFYVDLNSGSFVSQIESEYKKL